MIFKSYFFCKIFLRILIVFSLIFFQGCGEEFPLDKNISKNYSLLDQDSTAIKFPKDFSGKISLVGFIFTNCPDICPLTIHNMQRIQKKLIEMKISNVEFIAVSFDPLRDTPSVLKKQSELRNIDETNFTFLTGEQSEIDKLLEETNIYAFADDTTYTESGEPIYFFVHTDRISLIDQNNSIRKEYKGSYINLDEIVNDVIKLGD